VRRTLCAFVFLLVVGVSARADEWNKSFPLTARPTVVLEVDDGRIQVSAGAGKQVSANVSTTGWRIAPGEVQVDARQDGDRVEITVRVPRGHRFAVGARWVHVQLTVPNESDLNLHTRDGSITADGVKGTQRLRTGDGSIEATRLDGSVNLDTRDGKIRVDGRFDLLEARTGDGSIDADARPGSKMTSGWTLRTGDGTVTLRLPPDLAADLNASTGDGRVHVELPVTMSGSMRENSVRGKMNGGGPPLEIHSGDGSIRIQRF
jgi:Putative adhesin